MAQIFISPSAQAPDPASIRDMAEQAGRLAGLPEPITVTIKHDEWPPNHEGWRVMLVLGQRVVSVLLPPGELSVERLAFSLRLMAAGDPVP